MTDTQTVSARDLQVNDRINGARVELVDTTTTPGVVYVWIDGSTRRTVDMIFNHGDPIRITRAN